MVPSRAKPSGRVDGLSKASRASVSACCTCPWLRSWAAVSMWLSWAEARLGWGRGAGAQAAAHFFDVLGFLVEAGERVQGFAAFVHFAEAAVDAGQHVIIGG